MKHRIFSLFAVVGLAALACSAPQASPQPAPADTQGQPRYGGTVTFLGNDPSDWDLSYAGKSNFHGIAIAYDSLLGFKNEPDTPYSEMILRPELAERWEVSADGKAFTYHLRKGAKFQNVPPMNGREITSADVKWTFEYWSRTGQFADKRLPRGSFAYIFEGLDTLETPDPYTVTVRFKEPFGPFLNYSASEWNPIAAKEVFERDGHLKNQLAGSGPFILDTAASQKGTRWVWKKNPDYWDAGKPYLDEIRWLYIVDDSTAYAAFQTKQLDIIAHVRLQDVEQLTKGSPNATVHEYLLPRGSHAYISMARPNSPFQDIRVRRALALSIDRDEVIRVWTGGKGAWALPAATPSMFTQDEVKQMLKFDPAEARRLMAEAGYPNGVDLEWPIESTLEQSGMTLYQLLQAQMKKVGLNAVFKPMDVAAQRQRRYAGDYDIDFSVGSLGGVDVDVDFQSYGVYHSQSSGNWAKINDPELDKILVAGRREADPAKRRELLRAATKRIVDQVWAVEIIYAPLYSVTQPYVKGYHPHLGDRANNIAFSWLEK